MSDFLEDYAAARAYGRSDLLEMYDDARPYSSHEAVVRELARRIGVDPQTIERSLKRAQRSVSAPSSAGLDPLADDGRGSERASRRVAPGERCSATGSPTIPSNRRS